VDIKAYPSKIAGSLSDELAVNAFRFVAHHGCCPATAFAAAASMVGSWVLKSLRPQQPPAVYTAIRTRKINAPAPILTVTGVHR
jgi:hypothetical protein